MLKKRTLAIVMALIMAISVLPATAFAAGGNGDGGGDGISLQITGVKDSISIGEEIQLEATAGGKSLPEEYHIDWVKTDKKKYVNFVEQGQVSSGDEVTSKSKVKVKGIDAGGPTEITVRLMEGKTHTNTENILKEKKISIAVSAQAGGENDYGMQGSNEQKVQILQPSDIEVIYPVAGATNPSYYLNRFKTPIIEGNTFEFKFKADKEMSESKQKDFEKNAMSQIFLYDAGEKNILVSAQKGNLKYVRYGNDAQGRHTILSADTSKLPAGNYVLVVSEDFFVSTDSTKLGVPVKFQLTIKKAPQTPVRVKSVKLNTRKATLTQGKTKNLKAVFAPFNAANKAVTWTSSNKKVAKINSKGKVTAVAPGKATITLKTKDGGFKATMQVKVVPKAVKFKLKGDAGKVTVTYKKVKNATGYQIYRAYSKNGKYKKVTTREQKKAGKYISTGLTSNHTYYYKMRTYKTVKGTKYYSKYTKTVKVKTK